MKGANSLGKSKAYRAVSILYNVHANKTAEVLTIEILVITIITTIQCIAIVNTTLVGIARNDYVYGHGHDS